jgi:hypothetical protein
MCNVELRNSQFFIVRCSYYEDSPQRKKRQFGPYGHILLFNKILETWYANQPKLTTVVQDVEEDIYICVI